jgi:hypothetical protein
MYKSTITKVFWGKDKDAGLLSFILENLLSWNRIIKNVHLPDKMGEARWNHSFWLWVKTISCVYGVLPQLNSLGQEARSKDYDSRNGQKRIGKVDY